MSLCISSDYSVADNWLNLPTLNEHQYDKLPKWLLQPPSQSPSGTSITTNTITTTGSVHHPQQMNVDNDDQTENNESNNNNNENIEPSPSVQILSVPPSNSNNIKTSRSKPIISTNMNIHNRNSNTSFSWNTNTNVMNTSNMNLNLSSSNSNSNNLNSNPNPTQTLSSIINAGSSCSNLNGGNFGLNNHQNNNQHNNDQHSINMNKTVPTSEDCQELFNMLPELHRQLELENGSGKGMTQQQQQHYTSMIINMSKDLMHPYCLRLIPLLLAIKTLFKNREINAINTTRYLHKICLKYESLGQRQ